MIVPSAVRTRPWGARSLLPSIVVVVVSVAYNSWLLRRGLFFASDDWPWLWRAEFVEWSRYLEPFPSTLYNDRPVGAAFIKVLYRWLGLDRRGFAFALLALHAVNCVLLLKIALHSMRTIPAMVAATLAATWFSTLNALVAPANIFDLLGATLCLAVVRLRQLGAQSNRLAYDLGGALVYVLAIRTKEFALGMIAVVLLMSVLVERRTIMRATRETLPYLVVFVAYLGRYAQLLASQAPTTDSPYHLYFDTQTVVASLRFFVSTAFYETLVGPLGVAVMASALLLGIALLPGRLKRVAMFGLFAFVVTFGPTLFLLTTRETTYHELYLYTPHFFLSLAIGAVAAGPAVPAVLAVLLAVVIMALPQREDLRRNNVAFYLDKGRISQRQFEDAIRLLGTPRPDASIFIAGVEPFFNPFTNSAASSLKIVYHDDSLQVVTEKPDAALIAEFCAAKGPKRFLRFDGPTGTDRTEEIEATCGGAVEKLEESSLRDAGRGSRHQDQG